MQAISPINDTVAEMMKQQAQPPARLDAWRQATTAAQETALKREEFLQPLVAQLAQGVSKNVAVRNLLQRLDVQSLGQRMSDLATELGRSGKLPGRSTILGWLKAYMAEGKSGLLDNHTGRVRRDFGWEAQAVQLYNIPSKPSYAAVARKLREDHGFDSATYSAVRRYLQSLPATLGANSPQRLGRHLYNNSQKPFVHRTTAKLPVGHLYQADGHTLDIYLAHPVSGNPWRAELTLFMDVRSRYVVAWAISHAESAVSTMSALARALINHQHVPAQLYLDNGCGYKSRIMNDDNVGWYERLGINPIFALPGNAKAKGNVERFFRTMERDLNVFFEGFCGEGMSQEVSTKFFNAVKAGRKKLLTLDQWTDEFNLWLEKYHNRPHPEEKQSTPAQMWASLQHTPVNLDALDLMRPRLTRKVQRGYVRLHNRTYQHNELVHYNGRNVQVEYDLTRDDQVTVLDEKGRLICDATLVKKADYIPTSRIEEAQIKSVKASVKRLELKAQEKKKRAGLLIGPDEQVNRLQNFEADVAVIEPVDEPTGGIDLDIDLYDEDYLES